MTGLTTASIVILTFIDICSKFTFVKQQSYSEYLVARTQVWTTYIQWLYQRHCTYPGIHAHQSPEGSQHCKNRCRKEPCLYRSDCTQNWLLCIHQYLRTSQTQKSSYIVAEILWQTHRDPQASYICMNYFTPHFQVYGSMRYFYLSLVIFATSNGRWEAMKHADML